ncbi:MAG: hypothetical protein ACXADX_18935 [Candidatus Hodarchaeales archaeon]
MSRKLHLGPEVTVNSPIGIGCRLWGTLTVEKAVSLMEEAGKSRFVDGRSPPHRD